MCSLFYVCFSCDRFVVTVVIRTLPIVLYATFTDILNVFSISYEEHGVSWVYSYLLAN